MKCAISLIAACGLLLAACGGGDSSSGGGSGGDVVTFSLDPVSGPTCPGADDVTTFEGSFFTSVDCTWDCADYKGRTDAFVSIDFQRRKEPGAEWVKDNEFISEDGVCPV